MSGRRNAPKKLLSVLGALAGGFARSSSCSPWPTATPGSELLPAGGSASDKREVRRQVRQ